MLSKIANMRSPASLLAVISYALLVPAPITTAVPLQYTIPQRATECLYEKLEEDESVTVSVFGAELKATSIFEGPVAPPDAKTGMELQTFVKKYQMGSRFGDGPKGSQGNIRREDTVDFETDEWDDDDAMWDDDDEFDDDDYVDDDDSNRKKSEKTKSAMDRKAEKQKRMEERKKRYEKRRAEKIRRHNRASEGEGMQKTHEVEVAGWYRACVRGSWYQITAEIEMRKESELGGIDKRTGHVISYERRAMMDEEKDIENDNAEGLKDEDLKTANDQLRKLNRLLNEIKEEQQAERHRLSVHAATNEHSHSRMVLNSLLETVLFMAITSFQIYTVRKWFSGAPMLGLTRDR